MVEERIHFPVSEAAGPLFVGINFGITYLKIGVIDSDGRTVSYFSTPHHSELGPDGSVKHTAQAVLEALKKTGTDINSVSSIGYSFPGSMDPKTEKLHRPPNFPDWEDYPIVSKLAEYIGHSSVLFCNNANAAAYGEFWIGAAKGTQSVCLLLLDKGIGCGIIVEGREIKGANGYGGEFGHIIVDPSPGARWCNCLQQGHLEAYSSATAVARITREMLESGLDSSLHLRIDAQTPMEAIPRIVYEEAEKGDKLALQIISDTARFLGLGIVTLIHTIDPECVLIGGEMMFGGKGSKVGEMFLEKIRDEVNKRAMNPLADNLKIDFAALGAFGSYVGAAGLAREDTLLFTITGEE
jgi:glucokinase